MSNVQNMNEALDELEDDCEEAWFEPEDCECSYESGIESEWEWDCNDGVYKCTSCGAIQ